MRCQVQRLIEDGGELEEEKWYKKGNQCGPHTFLTPKVRYEHPIQNLISESVRISVRGRSGPQLEQRPVTHSS